MAREFEYSKHSNKSDDSKDGQRHGLIAVPLLWWSSMDSVVYVLLFCQDSGQRYEIRNDGHNVDDVHHIFKKVSLVWTTYDAYDDLESKPHYANCFDEKKWVCKVGHFILLDSRQIVSAVEKFIVSELRQRFKAKYDDRKENDHY